MKKLFLVALAATLGACTTTERVSVTQPGDRAMTCTELRESFVRLDRIIMDGQSDQGVNPANVGAVLFFWPAAVGNYLTARDAMEVADRRRAHLMTLYDEKNCDNAANADLVIMVPGELLAPITNGRR